MQQIEGTRALRDRLAAAEARSAQLERALESRVVIEQAKGVLAERLGLKVDDAFEALRYAARSARVNLHDLARRVVDEPRTPAPVVAALARQARWRTALVRERNKATGVVLSELAETLAEQIARRAAADANGG